MKYNRTNYDCGPSFYMERFQLHLELLLAYNYCLNVKNTKINEKRKEGLKHLIVNLKAGFLPVGFSDEVFYILNKLAKKRALNAYKY